MNISQIISKIIFDNELSSKEKTILLATMNKSITSIEDITCQLSEEEGWNYHDIMEALYSLTDLGIFAWDFINGGVMVTYGYLSFDIEIKNKD